MGNSNDRQRSEAMAPKDLNFTRKGRVVAMAAFFMASITFVDPGFAFEGEDGRENPCEPLADAELSAENLDVVEESLERALALLSDGDESGFRLEIANARRLVEQS